MSLGYGESPPDVKVAGDAPPITKQHSDEQHSGEQHSGFRRPLGLPGGKPGLVAIAAAAVVVLGGGAAFVLTGGSGSAEDAATVVPAKAAPSIAADAALLPTERERRKLAADRALSAARRDAAKRPILAVRGSAPPKKPARENQAAGATAGNPVPAGEAQRIAKAMLPKFGFDPDTQFGCLVNLWNRESSWNVHAGSPGGPYGIPQANPGTKMESAGSDWRDSATTQIEWGLGYIKDRYGNPCGAWSQFQSGGGY
jgi:hypothetical protein